MTDLGTRHLAGRGHAPSGASRWSLEALRSRSRSLVDELRTWAFARPVVAVSAFAVGAIAGLLINRIAGPARYRANVAVSITGGAGTELPALLSNLASSAALQLGGQTTPLAFQSYIVGSDPFLDTLLVQQADGCRGGTPDCRLVNRVAPDGSLAKGRRKLRDRLSSTRDERGRLLMISFADRDSTLARRTVDNAVAALGRVNRTLAATAAETKVSFLSAQLPFLTRAQKQIEDSLSYFYRTNRSFGSSPELRFREEQLKGLYDAQSRLVASVREQIARSEVQARGGLQIVQTVLPVAVDPKPERPFRNLAGAVGALFGTLAAFLAWRASHSGRSRRRSAE